ncbi:hypothetical protein VTJ83DRAFT_6111 [Remersonia thermophila]|uniref:Amidohydrolase-related domain-containing protein n=1 Tax=Remersonia thermophila TaxID=72144 RepID=A0ABR4DAW5_9PEZI
MDTKNNIPYSAPEPPRPWRQRPRRSRGLRFLTLGCLCFIAFAQWKQLSHQSSDAHVDEASPLGHGLTQHGLSVKQLREDLATCAALRRKARDPVGAGRERNARYIDGHAPTLIKNATVWTGEPVPGTSPEAARRGEGFRWTPADVYLEHGLIKRVEASIDASTVPPDTIVFHARGRPLTAGLIDMHSHAGVSTLPELWGTDDTNEMASDTTPYVRSIDGLNPRDPQIQAIKSGGVTTSLILPGSANNMGGEAFVVKHAVGRPDGRNETSAQDMLADPDRAWRYMKMACGENPKRVYGRVGKQGPTSRMGESWEFRHAFEQAAELKRRQEDWCAKAEGKGGIQKVKDYLPRELKWESLRALLAGQVKLHVHCYTVPDLEAMVAHSNEFHFRIEAFHHAHQTYLVPEILKRAYGGRPPAVAMFANTMWYKAEASVASVQAGRILHDNGLTPVYVSDNPVLNAQHLVFEAAKAHRYGLPYHAALASVTSAPAEHLGFGNRLGKVKAGFDADVVVWDSDPLSLGAAPVQVWIDGTAQFRDPVELKKPVGDLGVPEAAPRMAEEPVAKADVVFTGVKKVLFKKDVHGLSPSNNAVAVSQGKITCVGACARELEAASRSNIPVIHLRNGYVTESITAFGSKIGLSAIDAEKDTDNGPSGWSVFTRAADGLALDTIKTNASHAHGVTRAVTAPRLSSHDGTHHGSSVGFLTAARTPLDKGAVFASDAAVHYTLTTSAKSGETPSIASIIGALRAKLLTAAASLTSKKEVSPADVEQALLRRVVNGTLPLVLTAHSADTIAAVVQLKRSVEASAGTSLRVVVLGGAESHLVADELAAADVGVVLAPALTFPSTWDRRRALVGAPLTNGTAADALLRAGVKVGLGVEEDWQALDLGLYAGWVWRNGEGRVAEKEAWGLVSWGIDELLGLGQDAVPGWREGQFVVWEGSPLQGGTVKAVGGGRGWVDVWEEV